MDVWYVAIAEDLTVLDAPTNVLRSMGEVPRAVQGIGYRGVFVFGRNQVHALGEALDYLRRLDDRRELEQQQRAIARAARAL